MITHTHVYEVAIETEQEPTERASMGWETFLVEVLANLNQNSAVISHSVKHVRTDWKATEPAG